MLVSLFESGFKQESLKVLLFNLLSLSLPLPLPSPLLCLSLSFPIYLLKKVNNLSYSILCILYFAYSILSSVLPVNW